MLKENVLIVPGSRWAYSSYWQYGAYICQANRFFHPDAARLGYYVRGEIRPEFPTILARYLEVPLTKEMVLKLNTSSGAYDRQLGDVVDRLIRSGLESEHQQIFLLSRPGDPQTLVLPNPILNTKVGKSGKTTAWTQRNRYVSESALLSLPKTTGELDAWAPPLAPRV